jgi:hypothetical protein
MVAQGRRAGEEECTFSTTHKWTVHASNKTQERIWGGGECQSLLVRCQTTTCKAPTRAASSAGKPGRHLDCANHPHPRVHWDEAQAHKTVASISQSAKTTGNGFCPHRNITMRFLILSPPKTRKSGSSKDRKKLRSGVWAMDGGGDEGGTTPLRGTRGTANLDYECSGNIPIGCPPSEIVLRTGPALGRHTSLLGSCSEQLGCPAPQQAPLPPCASTHMRACDCDPPSQQLNERSKIEGEEER